MTVLVDPSLALQRNDHISHQTGNSEKSSTPKVPAAGRGYVIGNPGSYIVSTSNSPPVMSSGLKLAPSIPKRHGASSTPML